MTPDANALDVGKRTPATDKAKTPSTGWVYDGYYIVDDVPIHRWHSGDVIVCSSYCLSTYQKTSILVPQFHVSVTEHGARPSDEAVRAALADFGMEGADEDNHLPGRARHFWMCDDGRKAEPPCDCKATEETIVEPDGFRWQRKRGVDVP